MTPVPPVRMIVGDAVVARVAARCARQVPGVVDLRADLAQALLGLADTVLHPDRTLPFDGVHASVRESRADVAITLVTRLGHNCRDVAQRVQREVAAQVGAYTGLEVTVEVTVAEVLLD